MAESIGPPRRSEVPPVADEITVHLGSDAFPIEAFPAEARACQKAAEKAAKEAGRRPGRRRGCLRRLGWRAPR
eukprot:9819632-Lingulodinium_polyedra.AAC.1